MPDVAVWKGTTLRRSAKTPWQARQAVQLWLAAGDPAASFSALLLASELVTNVIQHVPAGEQRDWIKVRLGFADDFVRLEVIDPGTTTPEPRFQPLTQGSMKQSGRGLGLVVSLAIRYGTRLLACGHRVVWADLPRDQAPAEATDAVQDAADQLALCRP
ncbi:ATP-binding protein [Nonomuraea sp. NPDC049784]|uniref:ATP-binding protein n=1 Tax=Nonomuraea sp. NPDC049784 TaxID=3154361 RepID=UPI0033C0583C